MIGQPLGRGHRAKSGRPLEEGMPPLTRPSATLAPRGEGFGRVDVTWLYRETEYDSVTRGRCPGHAHSLAWPFGAAERDWHGHGAEFDWAAETPMRAAGAPLAAGRGSGFE